MSDKSLAIAAAASRNIENHLPVAAADFCKHYGLPVELETPVVVFAAEMVRYGINLTRAADALKREAAI